MEDYDRFHIYSVVVAPEYCPECGSEVGSREFDAGPKDWCGTCEMRFSRSPSRQSTSSSATATTSSCSTNRFHDRRAS